MSTRIDDANKKLERMPMRDAIFLSSIAMFSREWNIDVDMTIPNTYLFGIESIKNVFKIDNIYELIADYDDSERIDNRPHAPILLTTLGLYRLIFTFDNTTPADAQGIEKIEEAIKECNGVPDISDYDYNIKMIYLKLQLEKELIRAHVGKTVFCFGIAGATITVNQTNDIAACIDRCRKEHGSSYRVMHIGRKCNMTKLYIAHTLRNKLSTKNVNEREWMSIVNNLV